MSGTYIRRRINEAGNDIARKNRSEIASALGRGYPEEVIKWRGRIREMEEVALEQGDYAMDWIARIKVQQFVMKYILHYLEMDDD